MYSKFKLLIIFLVSTQVISCANNYDLSPKYNEESKILNLGKFSLENITYHRSDIKRVGDRSAARVETQVYKSTDPVCNKLDISIATLNSGYYFNKESYFDILDRYYGKCSIDNVANVFFLKCELPASMWTTKYDFDSKDIGRHAYYVSTGDSSTETRKKMNFIVPSEKCMGAIKDSVLSQMKVKKIRTYDPETRKWSEG